MPGISADKQAMIKIPLKKQTLIITLGAILNVDICKKVRDWFMNNQFPDFNYDYSDIISYSSLPEGFVEDEQVRRKVLDYLSSFDEGIINFIVNKEPIFDNSNEDYYSIKTVHKRNHSNETIGIYLSKESNGLLKMFYFYSYLHQALENGSLLFVDHLDAFLHPLLVKSILLSFLDSDINIHHSQLIFTTHDI